MRIYKLIIFLFICSSAYGQLETKNWFLTENNIAVSPSGVTTGLPRPADNLFHLGVVNTSVSDPDGNLLIAFNGNTILDRNMNVMPALANTELYASDGKMLIQQIPNSSKYYLFYTKPNILSNTRNNSGTLKYAIVDLSLNNGNGDVIIYDQVIDTNSSPAFTLVQGEDPLKAWLVSHRYATDSFFVYPITPAGLSTTPVISRAGTNATLNDYIFRDLKPSHNGKMIAGIAYRDYSSLFAVTFGHTEVFNFDPISATLSSKVRTFRTFQYFFQYFSVEFSPDNRLLYVSQAARINGLQPCGFGWSYVDQYNLCYADSSDFVKYSMRVGQDIQTCYPTLSWGNMQMGADKKIHFPYTGAGVSNINFPNRIGNSSNFVFNSYRLPNGNSGYVSTPVFHHKLLEKGIKNNIIYDGGCYPEPILFKITNDTIHKIKWDFGDPSSPVNNADHITPSHVFSRPGIYKVTADLYNSKNSLIETIYELVEIKDPFKRILADYPVDTNLCAGDFIDVKLKVVNGIYRWYQLWEDRIEINEMITDSIRIESSGTWYVEMKQRDCNGCTMLDSIKVTILPKPLFNLDDGISVCTGDSVQLLVNDPNADFLWSSGATTSSIWVKHGGLYWLEAEYNNNGCPVRDSVTITELPAVSFSLPQDSSLCNDQVLLLNPGVTNANYLWQDGSNDPTLQIKNAGVYWVKVTSYDGCSKSDSIIINYINTTQVNLGEDTVLCKGQSLSLQTNTGDAKFLWSNGSTNSFISVNETDNYWVNISKGECIVTDTIHVKFSEPPLLFLGNDTTLCMGDQLLLEPFSGGTQYSWQDGSKTSSYPVNSAGTYWVEVVKNGCLVRDTVNIYYHASATINLGPDARFCNGDSIVLDAGNDFADYVWSTGSTMNKITVFESANYHVMGITADGCRAKDTIQVLNLYALPLVDLGDDGVLCTGSNRVLNAGTGYNLYSWSNGSATSTISINDTGKYWVQVEDQQGCKASDTVQIYSLVPLPNAFLQHEMEICSYGSLRINPLADFNQYKWSTGSSSPAITITQPGTYWLEVVDDNQCHGLDSIIVKLKDCMSGVYIPTAFTPNNDGKNDLFKVLVFGNVEHFSFIVYNRWGQIVFQTENPDKGWNGTFGGLPEDSNVFTWVCRYKLNNEAAKLEKGTVMLVR